MNAEIATSTNDATSEITRLCMELLEECLPPHGKPVISWVPLSDDPHWKCQRRWSRFWPNVAGYGKTPQEAYEAWENRITGARV